MAEIPITLADLSLLHTMPAPSLFRCRSRSSNYFFWTASERLRTNMWLKDEALVLFKCAWSLDHYCGGTKSSPCARVKSWLPVNVVRQFSCCSLVKYNKEEIFLDSLLWCACWNECCQHKQAVWTHRMHM
jgi:hypothetical protein